MAALQECGLVRGVVERLPLLWSNGVPDWLECVVLHRGHVEQLAQLADVPQQPLHDVQGC
jgi:hypothetical protein